MSQTNQNAGEPTACEQYIDDNGDKPNNFTLTIVGKPRAILRVRCCRGAVQVIVSLGREGGDPPRVIANIQNITDWQDISLHELVAAPPAENYSLIWTIDGPVDDWQLLSEILVDDTVQYRHLHKREADVLNAEALTVRLRAS